MRLAQWCVVLAGCVVGAAAHSRDATGALGLLLRPHDGQPAVIAPGGAFEVLAREPASLALAGPARVPLEADWQRATPWGHTARVHVPDTVEPGVYALEAEAGGQPDRTPRAVYVQALASSYTMAHVAGPAVDADAGASAFETLLAGVGAEADLVVVTGPLTAHGRPADFARVLAALDACPKPVLAVPGGGEVAQPAAKAYFGPPVFTLWFGPDAFLAIPAGAGGTIDTLDGTLAALESGRRAIAAARWAIGLTHQVSVAMPVRAQLSLFVDTPLDHVFSGALGGMLDAAGVAIPWGETRLTVTPPAADGRYRLVAVSARGVEPGPALPAAED